MMAQRFSLIATLAALALGGCAQTPTSTAAVDHAAHHPGASGTSSTGAAPRVPAQAPSLQQMDAHMQAMRQFHEKFAQAKTDEERSALMAEHCKLMHEGMAMMGGKGGPGGMPCADAAGAHASDPAACRQLMEERMQKMQGMRDPMRPAAPKP